MLGDHLPSGNAQHAGLRGRRRAPLFGARRRGASLPRVSAPPHCQKAHLQKALTLRHLALLQMRFFVALCCVMEATAVSFDVTYTIIGASNVPQHDLLWDKSDPYVAIFDNGRQVGRTPTRNDDHNPIWQKRINFKLDSGSDKVCIYLFDRDTFDDSDAGANLEQMKTRNQWIAWWCNTPVREYGLSWCGHEYYPGSCEDVTRTDQTLTSDRSALTVTYDIKIVAILPPPPPPPPSPLPPPPMSPKHFVEDMGDEAKDVVDVMPGWLVAILIGVGSVCALGCFCKYCCADDDDRPSRSSVPVPVTPTTQASSSSSSASGLHWNQWAAFDRVLARTTHSAQNPGGSVLRAPH
jgi:hypothetical protein